MAEALTLATGGGTAPPGFDLKDVEARARLLPNAQPALSSAGRGWSRVQADLEEQPFLEVRDTAHRHHVLTLCLSDARNERRLGRRRETEEIHHGLVAFTPAGAELTSLCGGPVRFLNVLLDPALIEEQAPAGARPPAFSAVFVNQPDHGLSRLLLAVLDALQEDSALADLRADGLGLALARHLLRHHSDADADETRWNHGLTATQLRRVEELVAARPEERLTVQAMADTARLSVPHFTRQFRQATGLSPYQYVLHFRLEQARRAVLRTSLPLSAIAAEFGFTDEAHLCNAFRRRYGYAPGSLRHGRLEQPAAAARHRKA